MQRLEVSGAVRPIYGSLGDKRLITTCIFLQLTLILLTWRIWRAPNNASKWQMGFNSAFKGLMHRLPYELNKVHFMTTIKIPTLQL